MRPKAAKTLNILEMNPLMESIEQYFILNVFPVEVLEIKAPFINTQAGLEFF